MICLLVCVMAPNPMPEEFVHHLKQGVDGNPMLVLTGPAARTVARPDGQGLRVTLPAKRQKQDPISITPRFTIKGDFEATLSYDFLSSEDPLPKSGVGIHFSVKVVGDNPQGVSITRLRKPGDGKKSLNETYGANMITPGPDGKDKYDTKVLPATHKSGRLRIERVGGGYQTVGRRWPQSSVPRNPVGLHRDGERGIDEGSVHGFDRRGGRAVRGACGPCGVSGE